jgi:rare lipoprotein A
VASTRRPPEPSSSKGTTGTASYYGPGFNGRRTASGERFDQNALTAAHRSLPFGTRVRVTNLANGKSVVVRINDRGPFKRSRIIDLSKGAAQKIDMIGTGTARVRLEVLR